MSLRWYSLICDVAVIDLISCVGSSPGGIPARNARGERLLLFLGIIDILQSYRLKKKLEHTWKSMIHDGVSWPGFASHKNGFVYENRNKNED